MSSLVLLWGTITKVVALFTVAFSPPPYGGTVKASLPNMPLSWDPREDNTLGGWQVTTLLYDNLFRYDGYHYQPVLSLARSLVLSKNGKQVTIGIYPGRRSHSGQSITSRDVVHSLRGLQQSSNAWVLAAVTSIREAGQYEVTLSLSRPMKELTMVLASPLAAVIPRGSVSPQRPDGTGPFRYIRGDLKGTITLGAYTAYHAGRPYLNALELTSYPRAHDARSAFYLRRSALSYVGRRLFGKTPPFACLTRRAAPTATLGLLLGPKFDTLAVSARRALYTLFDKSSLRRLSTLAPTVDAHDPVPPGFLTVAQRKAIAGVAPWKPAESWAALKPYVSRLGTITLLVDGSEDMLALGRKIMSAMGQVGFTVTIQTLNRVDLASRLKTRRYDLVLHAVQSPVPLARYHIAAVYAAAAKRRDATRILSHERVSIANERSRLMRDLPFVPLFHVGVRLDVASHLGRLGLYLGGVVDWAEVSIK